MPGNLFLVSLTLSAVIILLLVISPLIRKRYGAKWCYFIWLVLALVAALAVMMSTMVACGNGQAGVGSGQDGTGNQQGNPGSRQGSALSQPDGYAGKLYQYKETYTGDNSKVGAIVHALNYADLPFKSLELKTDSEPYGIIVNYQVDSRADYRLHAYDAVERGWDKNAAVMFSLIPTPARFSSGSTTNTGTLPVLIITGKT